MPEDPHTYKKMDIPKEDQVPKTKTIYDAKYRDIIIRNFVAGMSRTVGSLVVYALFLFLVGYVFMQLLLPKIAPVLDNFLNIGESLKSLQNIKPPNNILFRN